MTPFCESHTCEDSDRPHLRSDCEAPRLVDVVRCTEGMPAAVWPVHAWGDDSAEVIWPVEGPRLAVAEFDDGVIDHAVIVTGDACVVDAVTCEVWAVGIYPYGSWFSGLGEEDTVIVDMARHLCDRVQLAELIAELAPVNTPEGCDWSAWAVQRLTDHEAHLALI